MNVAKKYLEFSEEEYKKAVEKLKPLGLIKNLIKTIDKRIDTLSTEIEGGRLPKLSVAMLGIFKKEDNAKEKQKIKFREMLEERRKLLLKMMEEFDGYISILYLAGVYDVFEKMAEDEEKGNLNQEDLINAYNLILKKHGGRKSKAGKNYLKFKDEQKDKDKFEERNFGVSDEKEIVSIFHNSAKKYSELLDKLYKNKTKEKTYELRYKSLEEEMEKAYYTGFTDALTCPDVFNKIKGSNTPHNLANLLGTTGSETMDKKEEEIQEKHQKENLFDIVLELQRLLAAT